MHHLVSDGAVPAPPVDPNLKNGWGRIQPQWIRMGRGPHDATSG